MIYQRTPPTRVGGKLQQHLYFDDMTDFANLPKVSHAAPGSDAYCVEDKRAYIMSGKGIWEEQ